MKVRGDELGISHDDEAGLSLKFVAH